MMGHLPYPAARGEDMGEVAFPLCWVGTLPKAAHRRGVKHRLDATAHPARCLGLLRPDRIEHLHDKPGVDRSDRQLTQNRINVSGEGVAPLLPMLCVTPARLLSADKLFGHLAEGATPGDGKSLRMPLGFLGCE